MTTHDPGSSVLVPPRVDAGHRGLDFDFAQTWPGRIRISVDQPDDVCAVLDRTQSRP